MANPEHMIILKEGVDVWNTWRSTRGSTPDLQGADLRRTQLANYNFGKANLSSSDLRGASLVDANFRGSNLTGARLRDSSLARAKFQNTLLENTDFHYASLLGSTFIEVDLSEAQGLSSVLHRGHSFVDVTTLQLSKGKVPGNFLRGCGLPENLIAFLPSLFATSAIEFFSCFISYSHVDYSLARRLHDQLQARGIRCWLDEHDLKPGDRILDVVSDAIRLHDKILLCCSEASLESWWVKDEIRKAQERERAQKEDIIIPLMIDHYLLDGWEDGLAADLRSRLAADFTGWEHDNAKFEEQFERVMIALRTDEAAQAEV